MANLKEIQEINAESAANRPAGADRKSQIGRRGFFGLAMKAGAAAVGAVLVSRASNAAAQAPFTLAVGEESSFRLGRWNSGPIKRSQPRANKITTHAIGEEGNPPNPAPMTTFAVGEEGQPNKPNPTATTAMVGEEGQPSPTATTHRVGEEGHPNVTTRALGEEGQPNIGRPAAQYHRNGVVRLPSSQRNTWRSTPDKAGRGVPVQVPQNTNQLWRGFRRW